MLFSSSIFIYCFLPFVLLVYYVILRKSRKLQNFFLFIASLFFYAWGEPKFVLIMLLSIAANWFFGLLVGKYKNININKAKLFVWLSVVFNVLILFVFKYLTFTGNVIKDIFNFEFSVPEIALPIGISFFTFQAMSYVIDVYRGHGEVQKNICNVGLYISFFPQLIAGPIVRFETIADQIENRKETADDFFDGFGRFVVGLSKKVLLANNFALLADFAFDYEIGVSNLSALTAWLGACAYMLQIYFDFSGYSDMAIGLGKMFGFHFLENFNYPYISTSITEFWRRWHISLSSWFRDYVYIPLGGSRVSKSRLILNLFVVWLLTGVWHGANWTFVAWGLMYFVLLVFEKLTGIAKMSKKKYSVLRWAVTMFFVLIGWVIFRADSLPQAVEYIKSMFCLNSNSFTDDVFLEQLRQGIIYFVFGAVCSLPLLPIIKKKFYKENFFAQALKVILLCLMFVLSLSSIVSGSYNPFIYFNF